MKTCDIAAEEEDAHVMTDNCSQESRVVVVSPYKQTVQSIMDHLSFCILTQTNVNMTFYNFLFGD